MVEVTVYAQCWLAKGDNTNLSMMDMFIKTIELPVVPRIGETVQLSFEEDGKTRNVLIDDVNYVELSTSFLIRVYGKETKVFGK